MWAAAYRVNNGPRTPNAPKWVAVANSSVRLSQARIGSGGACTGTARDRCSDKTGTPVSARAGWGVVSELDDSFRDPAPCRRAVLIIGGSEFVGMRHAFLKGVIAVALEHQLRRSPDVDLGDHAAKGAPPLSINV